MKDKTAKRITARATINFDLDSLSPPTRKLSITESLLIGGATKMGKFVKSTSSVV